MRLGKYLKAAFSYHWNLLAFLGGAAFALISGAPDVLLPVVVAGEIAGGLAEGERVVAAIDRPEVVAGAKVEVETSASGTP